MNKHFARTRIQRDGWNWEADLQSLLFRVCSRGFSRAPNDVNTAVLPRIRINTKVQKQSLLPVRLRVHALPLLGLWSVGPPFERPPLADGEIERARRCQRGGKKTDLASALVAVTQEAL